MTRSGIQTTRSSSSHEEDELSSEVSDSESESNSDRPGKADPNIKPLASKPMNDDRCPPRKARIKNPISRYSPPPLKSPTGKRPATTPESEARGSKRVKNDEETKQFFQRLWSEDDEVELIKGMINYFEKTGKDPTVDVTDFHGFVKKSLNVDVSKRQVSAKVRRLKRKFLDNAGRIEKKAKVRAFSKPHEKKMYELSKKLWGSGSSGNNHGEMVTFNTKKDKSGGKSLIDGKGKVEQNADFVSCSTKKDKSQNQRNGKSLVNGNEGLEQNAGDVSLSTKRDKGQRNDRSLVSGNGVVEQNADLVCSSAKKGQSRSRSRGKSMVNGVGGIEVSEVIGSPITRGQGQRNDRSLVNGSGVVDQNADLVSLGTKKGQSQSRSRDKSMVNGVGGVEVSEVIGLPITEEAIVKKGLELVSGAKKVELEEKWRNLKMLELEHLLKKLEFMKEQAEVVLKALKKHYAS